MIEALHLVKEFIRTVKEEENKKSGFSFGKKTTESFYAVNDISFRAHEGEILGILGPNGAGKTTLLRMLGHLMTPTAGEVILTDKEGNRIDDEVKIKLFFFSRKGMNTSGGTTPYSSFFQRKSASTPISFSVSASTTG